MCLTRGAIAIKLKSWDNEIRKSVDRLVITEIEVDGDAPRNDERKA